ncbi:MAG: HAD-IA family hydrolase [Acidobacteria bacterium]|nr:HAD-IA family hydrolase [Acidobacteriota bacterium]
MGENTNRRKVILFDFDGTLVNTTPLILRSFRATWEKTFGFTMDDAVYIKTFGTHLPAAMKQLAEQCVTENRVAPIDDLEAKAAELLKTYREINWGWHDQHIEAFEGVGEAVRELKARNYRLGIVSSKIRFGVERGLNLFSMAEPFDHIIAADDVANHKPHPEPILKALEHFGASPHEAIYIGDSTHDIVAGKAARVATVAAAWGPFPRTELEALKPDHLLDEPGELLRLFQK